MSLATRFSLLALLLAALAFPAAAQQKQEKPAKPSGPPTWYAQSLTRGEGGLNVTHFWSKGSMMRAETVVAAHKIITIVHGDRYYAYDGLTGEGLSIRRQAQIVAGERPHERPFGREYDLMVRQGGELVREETLLDRRAGIYRVTDERGRRELWVTQDELRMPLRIEIFERERGSETVIDYVNWQSDFAIDDGFFLPDARAKLEEMDYTEYLRRSMEQGSVGPVPVFYMNMLFTKKP